jgi:hypothetical protein
MAFEQRSQLAGYLPITPLAGTPLPASSRQQPEESRSAMQAPTEVLLTFACAPRLAAMLLSPLGVHAQTSRRSAAKQPNQSPTSDEATAQRSLQGRTSHTRGRMLLHSRSRGSRALHLTPAHVRLRTSRCVDSLAPPGLLQGLQRPGCNTAPGRAQEHATCGLAADSRRGGGAPGASDLAHEQVDLRVHRQVLQLAGVAGQLHQQAAKGDEHVHAHLRRRRQRQMLG